MPRCSQYSRISRSCISGSWPASVLTLAYRATRTGLSVLIDITSASIIRAATYKSRCLSYRSVKYNADMGTKKNPHAVALGKKGGKARAAKLSAEELSKQGRRAVLARWAKTKKR